ncbi:MAG: hypothetical protein ABR592_06510 [Nitriliruptorales bacterium]
MQPVAIVTIIGTVLTVLVLAAYLITVIVILAQVNSKLRTILSHLWSISNQTDQLGSTMTALNGDLTEANEALRNALYRQHGGERAPAR